jgi:hypothetical protein
VTSPLNQGQEEAAEQFFQFLFSPEKEFGISGGGGVGKTHWMGHIIDVIMPRYLESCKLMDIEPEYVGVQMTATTNKAAEVLSKSTNRPCSTIHSYLGLKVKDDYKTGRSILTKTNSWTVHEDTVLFVDECSMIDTNLDNFVNEGTQNCKIVYVGDHCQLAPVMEPGGSPIYRRNYPFYELTEPMRTKIPALQDLNEQLRETVKTGVFKPIKVVPGIIDHLDDQQMQIKLQEYFKTQTHEARVLAYTNRRVMQFNDYIRQVRQLPDAYTVGEFLVNNSALELRTKMLPVEADVTIQAIGDLEAVPIDKDVDLWCRKSTLVDGIGSIYTDVMIPEDRSHYTALVDYYRKAKNWERYYALKKKFPDLRQRDSATSHKAQGSTYKTVFIDLGDISTCHNPDQVARMLYVVCSRAQERIFLFGNLAEKYGGLIQ